MQRTVKLRLSLSLIGFLLYYIIRVVYHSALSTSKAWRAAARGAGGMR